MSLPFTWCLRPPRGETEVLFHHYLSKYATNKVFPKFIFTTWTWCVDKIGDILRVKSKTALVSTLLRVKLVAGGSSSKKFESSVTVLIVEFCKITQAQGLKGLVTYLKVASVSLQQAAAGHRIRDIGRVGVRISRTRSGYPRIIPAPHRLIIINRSPGWDILLRFYLSAFGLYRIIPLVGPLKLDPIIKPGRKFDLSSFTDIPTFIRWFFKGSLAYNQDRLKNRFAAAEPFPILRSSPQTSIVTSQGGWVKPTSRSKKLFSKFLWSSHPLGVLNSLKALSGHWQMWAKFYYFAKTLSPSFAAWSLSMIVSPARSPGVCPYLGRLALKIEPAGKVRVFAMVDPFTQWLLAPLHKFLFSTLRKIPMDGTFNQLRPIHRLLRMGGPLYSLDLSSATDRLPVSLQAKILDYLLPSGSVPRSPLFSLGKAWSDLLVLREYVFTGDKLNRPRVVKYSVGQPMGALSSWAMLALVHHYLVQLAAWRAGYPKDRLFTKYAVLGDDLVLGDTKVKTQYLLILHQLGVECGLHKSILSRKGKGLEFAKSTFIDGINVSPISFKEFGSSVMDLASWSAFARKWGLSFDRQARILGFGYKARRKSPFNLNGALSAVYLSSFLKADINSQFLSSRPGAVHDMNRLVPTMIYEVFTPILRLIDRELCAITRFDSLRLSSCLKVPKEDRVAWNSAWRGVFDPVRPAARRDLMEAKKLLLAFIQKVDGSFDEALQLYLTIARLRAIPILDQFTLEGIPVSRDTRLPYQVRVFRMWTRMAPKLIKQYRDKLEFDRFWSSSGITDDGQNWFNAYDEP